MLGGCSCVWRVVVLIIMRSRLPRIAYVTSTYPAPSHTFIEREVNALRALGFDVRTFSVNRPDKSYLEARIWLGDRTILAETQYLLPAKPSTYAQAHLRAWAERPGRYLKTFFKALSHRPDGVKHLFKSVAHFLEAIVLADMMKAQGIERVHNHFANSSATVSYLASFFLGLKWSVTLHAHSETDFPACVTLPAKLYAADFVVAISNFMKAQALRILSPEHWHKVHNVGCGVDADKVWEKYAGAKRNRAPVRSIKFISVARLADEKGHAGLFEAFAKVKRRVYKRCMLTLIGDGPARERLEQLAIKMNLQGNISFRGALPEEETLAEIAAHDCLVLGSFMEGIPVVMLEAMALKTPFVVPAVAGIPEVCVLQPQPHGFMFSPTDWQSMSEKMLQAVLHLDVGDVSLAAATHDHMTAHSFVFVKQKFDSKKQAEKLSALFQNTH